MLRTPELALGAARRLLPLRGTRDLSHGDINQRLGESGDYIAAVERFLGGLDASIARALALR